MNKNILGFLLGCLILSIGFVGLAMSIDDTNTEPKQPQKEKVTFWTVDGVMNKYHQDILAACPKFHDIVKQGDYDGSDVLYRGANPMSTSLNIDYKMNHHQEYVDVTVLCKVGASYFINIYNQGSRTYTKELGPYTFEKIYSEENPLDLVHLKLVQ